MVSVIGGDVGNGKCIASQHEVLLLGQKGNPQRCPQKKVSNFFTYERAHALLIDLNNCPIKQLFPEALFLNPCGHGVRALTTSAYYTSPSNCWGSLSRLDRLNTLCKFSRMIQCVNQKSLSPSIKQCTYLWPPRSWTS